MLAPEFFFDKFDKHLVNLAHFIACYFRSEMAIFFLNLIRFHKAPFIPFKLKCAKELFPIMAYAYDDELQVDSFRRVTLLNHLQIPTFLVYGSDERLVARQRINLLHQLLKIDKKIFIFKDNPELLAKVNRKKTFSSYVLSNAGHFPHIKYSKIVNKLIELHLGK